MSLVRAFTTRRGKADVASSAHVGRAASQRAGKPVHRTQISAPVALVSTTNPLSYDAPDIAGTTTVQHRHVSAASTDSFHTAEDSDTSATSIGSHTDASSVDASPISTEPEPNHLSCYFKPNVGAKTSHRSPTSSACDSFDSPAIPRRELSHSKKAHEHMHRKRSVQRLMSPPTSVVRRNSNEMFEQLVEAPRENPFGSELAQLDEVQEELSSAVRDAERDADSEYMHARGLGCFNASDYLSEIHSLIYDVYLAEEPVWI